MNVAFLAIFWTYAEKSFLPHRQLLKTRLYDFVFYPYPAATMDPYPFRYLYLIIEMIIELKCRIMVINDYSKSII